ncbi:hypothetical protein EDB80DRAFT_571036 [Ilyonectria destructans]|nr:hypothetical protein EDB80DRAFT_571036 [Ilyonectria destructans]
MINTAGYATLASSYLCRAGGGSTRRNCNLQAGGVASPTGAITHVQFTGEEIRAITTVARGVGTYVTAHAYTPAAIRQAISNGVTCIEHGNLTDTETAIYMAENKVFLAPTVATYVEMGADKWHGFLPPSLAPKNKLVLDAGLNAIAVAQKAGVTMCYGTDLLGPLHVAQARWLILQTKVLTSAESLQTAAVNAAKLLRQEDCLGQIKPGFAADILILNANPLKDITIFERGEQHVLAVIKGGVVELGRWGIPL